MSAVEACRASAAKTGVRSVGEISASEEEIMSRQIHREPSLPEAEKTLDGNITNFEKSLLFR